MEFKCNCHNSGTNSYTGQCSNCGMTKPSITLKGTIVTLNSAPMEYKTMKQAELEINPPRDNYKSTPLTKQSIYNQIRLLVNTTSNDMLLGEAVRKLFI